jgi:thioester reductase-like protein
MSSRSSDIGLDSLVSVNVRSWFLKHLQVGIPVLKIMGNDTMGNLVRLAMETMPAELIPLLHASAGIEQDANTGSQGSPLDTNTSSSSTGTKGTTSPITSEDEEPEFKPYATKYLTDETGTDKVDWELESRPPADLFGIARATQRPWPKMPPEVIVLTGVSGLYGKHLLKYLLENTSARKIICLAIRNLPTRLESAELPPPGPRVEYHEGNLSAPLLGLNPDMADAIFDEADAVIHNGADTSHMKGFFDLKASNVGSTVTLTRLCLPRRIPLHYVSSVGLAILYGQDAFPPVSIAGAALPATDGSFGYASCKWTCERLLERTHEHYGGEWLVCLHRPSTIMRQGEDAVGMKAQLDWVHALLDYARKSRTVPRIRHNNGALDLVHPDNACAALVAPVMKPSERMARGEVDYVHQVGDMVLPLDRLQDIGVKEEGTAFKEVPMDDWVAKAVEGGMHPAVAALVEIMDEPGGHSYPKLLKELPAGQ